MKKSFVLLALLAIFAACSNPLLKWIDTSGTTYRASDKSITGFSFGINGEVDEIRLSSPRTDGKIPITVVLPAGQDPARLPAPRIIYDGKTISPRSGEWQDFTAPLTYTVSAEDGSVRDYEVEVLIKGSNPPLIKWFDIELSSGSIMAEGVVTEGSAGQPGSIDIRVPSGTSLDKPLSAKIVQTGTLVGSGVTRAADTAQTVTAVFSTPQTYTVAAEGGAEKTYNVTVSRIPAGDKAITAFSFDGIAGSSIIGAESQPNGSFPVVITLPAGTPIDSLVPKITHTGVSITGPGFPSSTPGGLGTVTAASVNFSDPAAKPFTYTVTAEDGSTQKYAVTVGFASDPGDDGARAITAFYFTSPVAVGDIDEANKTITVTVPNGTRLNALSPTVAFTGKSLSPASGDTQDFTSPVTYTVTARNNPAVSSYQVRVIPRPSSAKEITDFSFTGVGIKEAVIGAVPDSAGTIPVAITVAENTNTSSLLPVINHTGKTISPGPGVAGNFTIPVVYTVTAEDGSVKKYAVTVHIAGDGNKIITGFVFTPENNAGLTVSAVGEIIQGESIITVAVPAAVAIDSLTPVISYLGASINYYGESPSTAKPFTDGPRNFESPQIYTVTDGYNYTRDYEVRVTKIPEYSVVFQPPTDPDLISGSYDSNTGILTITLSPPSGYGPPYLWRLDSTPYPVSSPAETSLTLKIKDLAPGNYQISASARNTADGLDYDNELYFLVQE